MILIFNLIKFETNTTVIMILFSLLILLLNSLNTNQQNEENEQLIDNNLVLRSKLNNTNCNQTL